MQFTTFALILSTILTFPLAAATLDESFQSALSKGEAIRQGAQQVIQAEEQIDQAVGKVLPNLSFNASHIIQQLPSDPIARSFSPQHQTTAALTVRQPLFSGFREFDAYRGFKHIHSAQKEAQVWRTLKLYGDVAESHLAVLNLEQDVRNLEEQVKLYDVRVKELGSRAERGESSDTEVISAEATQASLQAEVRMVQGQLRVARERYAFVTGLPANEKLVDPETLERGNTKVGAVDSYLARVEARADVKAAKEKYEASDEQVSASRGSHWPSLEAVGNYYLVRPGFLSDIKWDVGLTLKFPIFEGGSTQSMVRSAVSQRAEAELELSRVRRLAIQEIRSLHESLAARLEHMEKLKRAAELSQKNSVLMQRDYRRGLARNIDVQLALTELGNARRNYDKSRFAGQLELIQLKIATNLTPEASSPSSKGN